MLLFSLSKSSKRNKNGRLLRQEAVFTMSVDLFDNGPARSAKVKAVITSEKPEPHTSECFSAPGIMMIRTFGAYNVEGNVEGAPSALCYLISNSSRQQPFPA